MPDIEDLLYLPTGPLLDRIEHAQARHDEAAFGLHQALMVNLARVVRVFFPTAEVVTMGEEGRWEPPHGLTLTSVRDGDGTVLWDVGESRHHMTATFDDYTWPDVARYIGPNVSTGIGAGNPGDYWTLVDLDEDITQYEVPLVDRETVTAWTTTPAVRAAKPRGLRALRSLRFRSR